MGKNLVILLTVRYNVATKTFINVYFIFIIYYYYLSKQNFNLLNRLHVSIIISGIICDKKSFKYFYKYISRVCTESINKTAII